MTFSLLYTSRRPHSVAPVVETWLTRAHDAGRVEFVFTADQDDRDTARAMLQEVAKFGPLTLGMKGPFPAPLPGSCVQGWNLAARHSTGDWLIAISDDFEPPEGWDAKLSDFINRQPGIMLPWSSRNGAIMVNDGIHNPESCLQTLGLISRGRYERLGYMSHPAYVSMFDDTERGLHAKQDGVMMIAPDLLFKHHHYINGEREHDSVDAIHGSKERYHYGRRVFEARLALGFPIDAGPNRRKGTPDPDPRFIAYILAADPEFALWEVCAKLYNQHDVEAFYFSVPTQLWNGQKLPSSIFDSIESIALRLAEAGCQCHIQHLTDWELYSKDVVNFSDIEGRARNAAMKNIQELGYRHVLIVDTDELWREGLIEKLRAMIASDDPPAYVSCQCIPVLNGYPIEGATDIVGVYMDATRNRFLAGRSTYYPGPTIMEPMIFHLTATRENMEALKAKMRTSAHYDDPDYAFEEWMAHRLPKIRPGSRDVHMYKPGLNVWPLVRHWKREEILEFPVSLRFHLKA